MAFQKLPTRKSVNSRAKALVRLQSSGKGARSSKYYRLSIPTSVVDQIRRGGFKLSGADALDVYLDESTLQLAIKFHPKGERTLRFSSKQKTGQISVGSLGELIPVNTAFTWEPAPPMSGFDIILTPLTEVL